MYNNTVKYYKFKGFIKNIYKKFAIIFKNNIEIYFILLVFH